MYALSVFIQSLLDLQHVVNLVDSRLIHTLQYDSINLVRSGFGSGRAVAGCGHHKKGKDSLYSTAEHRVPELIPVLGSEPASDLSHKPGGMYRLPELSARPAVTPATLKRAATNFAAW